MRPFSYHMIGQLSSACLKSANHNACSKIDQSTSTGIDYDEFRVFRANKKQGTFQKFWKMKVILHFEHLMCFYKFKA